MGLGIRLKANYTYNRKYYSHLAHLTRPVCDDRGAKGVKDVCCQRPLGLAAGEGVPGPATGQCHQGQNQQGTLQHQCSTTIMSISAAAAMQHTLPHKKLHKSC